MIFQLLDDNITFPNPELAETKEPFNGLLAIGGTLSWQYILEAYRNGIFPWYSENSPILWWSPDPRFVLFTEKLHVSRRLERTIRQKIFDIRFNTAFEQVMRECAKKVPDRPETWIHEEMISPYVELYKRGYALSAEAWKDNKLVGGLYGVILGNKKKIFCGESMFHRVRDASKVAFVTMIRKFVKEGLFLVDCQLETNYLKSFGAENISRKQFLKYLKESLDS